MLFTLVATFTYVTFHLAAPPYRLGPLAISFIFFTYLIGAAITPPCGRIIDRYGHRTALAVAMATGIAGMLLTLVPELYAVVAGLALCCSGVFVAQATTTSYIGLATDHGKRPWRWACTSPSTTSAAARGRTAGLPLALRGLGRLRGPGHPGADAHRPGLGPGLAEYGTG